MEHLKLPFRKPFKAQEIVVKIAHEMRFLINGIGL